MTFPTGFNAGTLSPKVLIYNLAETLQYTYESSQIATSPTQDFNLRALSLHIGSNDDYGNAVLIIDDPNNEFTDGSARKASKIKRQWMIKIYLGKDGDTINLWFTGKIMETDVIRPDTNLQQIRLVCAGWGIRLKDRLTNLKRFQAKDTDGLALDTTDTTTRVSELVLDLFTDTDHHTIPNLGTESAITTTGVSTVDVKMANLQEDYQSWAAVMAELASDGNATYFIDQNRNVNFTTSNITDSGMLFTNNIDGSLAQNWDADKLGFLYRQPLNYTDSTVDCGYSILHGYGADIIKKDVEQTSSNATRSAHSSWVAIPITPTRDNIAKVALTLGKTGTPSSASYDYADFRLIGVDGSAAPNSSDLRKQTLIQKSKLDSLSGTPGWFEIPFDNQPVVPRDTIYLVFKIFGDVTNTFVASYQTGSGTYYTSADGSSWASAVGSFKVRTFSAYPVKITLEDVTARNKYGIREMAIPFRKTIQQESARRALIMASDVLCTERRTYSRISVTPPTDRIPIGQYCLIQDSFNSMSIFGEIAAIDISMQADDSSNIGANVVQLTMMEHHF